MTADLSVLLQQLKGHAETAARTEALSAVDPLVVAALVEVAEAAEASADAPWGLSKPDTTRRRLANRNLRDALARLRQTLAEGTQ